MTGAGRKPTVSDAEILLQVRAIPEPIVTAKGVAERIDMTPQGANNRMRDLVEQGYLKKKKVGSRAVVYWLTDAGKQKAADAV